MREDGARPVPRVREAKSSEIKSLTRGTQASPEGSTHRPGGWRRRWEGSTQEQPERRAGSMFHVSLRQTKCHRAAQSHLSGRPAFTRGMILTESVGIGGGWNGLAARGHTRGSKFCGGHPSDARRVRSRYPSVICNDFSTIQRDRWCLPALCRIRTLESRVGCGPISVYSRLPCNRAIKRGDGASHPTHSPRVVSRPWIMSAEGHPR